jgi:putative ATPase subunit of terminase (gpP-like)
MSEKEMNREQKRETAKGLFVKSDMTQKEIAVLLGVSEKTVSEWRKKYDWDSARQIQSITRKSLLEDAYRQLDAINQKVTANGGIPDKALSDAKAECLREIEKFSDTPTHIYIDVFEDFCAWLSKYSPKELRRFSELSLRFVENKQQDNGKG